MKSYYHRVKDTKKVELSHSLGKALGCIVHHCMNNILLANTFSTTENYDPPNFDLVLEDMDEDEPTANVEQTASFQNPVDVVPIHS